MTSEPENIFQLEGLEERIMLSGDSLFGAAPVAAAEQLEPLFDPLAEDLPVEEVQVFGEDIPQDQTAQGSSAYNPAQDLTDIFSGLSEEELNVAQADNVLPDERTDLAVHDEIKSALSATDSSSEERPAELYDVLDTRLRKSVYDYFGDSLDPPCLRASHRQAPLHVSNESNLSACLAQARNALQASFAGDNAGARTTLAGNYFKNSEGLPFLSNLSTTPEGEVCLEITAPESDSNTLVLRGNQITLSGITTTLPDIDTLRVKAGTIHVTGALDFAGDMELEAHAIRVDAPITASNISLTTDEIDIQDDLKTFNGGTLTLQPLTPATSIGIADRANGDFNLSTAELDRIVDGFQQITIGRADGQHLVEIQAYTFRDSVTVNAPMQGGGIRVLGLVDTTGPDVEVTFNGSYSTTVLYADINTNGGSYTFNDSVEIAEGKTITISTGGGEINFNSTVNGQAGGVLEHLILDAGTGTIKIDGNVGDAAPLGSLTIKSAGTVTFAGFVIVDGPFIQNAGSTTNFSGNVTADSINITTTNSIIFGTTGTTVNVSTDPGGITLKVDKNASPGLISFEGAVNSAGDLTISEAKDVTFSNHTVSIGGALTQTDGGNATTFGGTVVADSVDLNVHNLIQFNGILNVPSGNDIVLVSDEINFSTTADSVIGSGTLTLKPYTNGTNIDVGSLSAGSGTRLEINTTDLAALKDGFSTINIGGQSVNEGPVLMGDSTFKDPVNIFGTGISVTGTVLGDTSINLTARTGQISISEGGSLAVSDTGSGSDITVTAATDILIPNGCITAADAVSLTASNGQIDQTTGLITGTSLTANATASIDLNTQVNSLTARSTATGSIEIDETDTITLTGVETNNGTITVNAGSDILMQSVSAAAGAGNVTLTSDAGAILDDTGAEDANLIADVATLMAATGIGTTESDGDLDVRLNTLNAENTGASGDIVITELAAGSALTINKLFQSNAGGTGAARVVVEAGSMTISGQGVDVKGSGGVYLDAQGGFLELANNIPVKTTSGNILCKASGAVTFGDSASISSTAGGNITVWATGGAITQNGDITTATGTIDVEASGGITMAWGASAVTTGQNIRYIAGGAVSLGVLDARNGDIQNQENWGEVSVRAGAGSITDAAGDGDTGVNIYAAAARFSAPQGIGTPANFIETELGIVSASAGAGGINLIDSTEITVGTVGLVPAVRVEADGTTTVQDASEQSGLETTPDSNGRIALLTNDGRICVDKPVTADGSGNVLINAQGSTGDNVVLGAAVTSGAGNISIIAAGEGNVCAAVRPLGGNNDIFIRARTSGSELAGVTVRFIDDNTLTGDQAEAIYNPDTRVLSINIRNGVTTANTVIAAIDGEGTFDASRDTSVETSNDGTGTIHTAESDPTSGGTATTNASVQVYPLGNNNDLTFTAAIVGSEWNDATVRFIDDGTLTGNEAEAVFSILSQTLVINIANGVTTASAVIDAVALDGTFVASLNRSVETGNDGSGVIHTAPVTMACESAVRQTAAGNIITGGTGTIYVKAGAGTIYMADGAVARTAGGNIRYDAVDSVVLGLLDTRNGADQSNWGEISVVAANGSIVDAAAGGDTAIDVYAKSARFTAGVEIGELGGTVDALETEVSTIAATAGSGGISLIDLTGVEVTTIGKVPVTRMNADNTTEAVEDGASLSDLVTSENGAIVLRTVDGHIKISDGDVNNLGVVAGGSGNILLQAQDADSSGSGSYLLINAGIHSGSGSITILGANAPSAGTDAVTQAAGGDILTAGSGSIIVEAQTGSVAMADGATTQAHDGNIRYLAVQDVKIGSIMHTGQGDLSITAINGSILDAGVAETDLMGAALRLVAGMGIGELSNPLETAVGTVAAFAGSGDISLIDNTSVAVGTVGQIPVNRVQPDATTIPNHDSGELSDLATGSNGSIVLRTVDGSITVNEGGDADNTGVYAGGTGNILIQAQGDGNDIVLNACVKSGSGNITVLAAHSVDQKADILTVGGTIDLEAEAGSASMAEGTASATGGANIRYRAAEDVTLGSLNAGGADVSVTATSGSILDAGVADTNITSVYLRLVAGTGVGELDNPLETAVDTVAAFAGSGDISLIDNNSVVVDTVGQVPANRVQADATTVLEQDESSLSDLMTGANGSIVFRTVDGSIRVNEGDPDDTGISAGGAGNVLLQAQGEGQDVVVNADIESDSGNISLLAPESVIQAGDIITGGSGTIDVEASSGSISMAHGVKADTAGGNIRYHAKAAVALSSLNAGSGDVGVTAEEGSITDGDSDVDIAAGGLRLSAGYAIGGASDPVEIEADTVSAFAGPGGINLLETDDVTVGPVDLHVERVSSDGTTEILYDECQSGLYATDAGFVVFQSAGGSITIEAEPARAILFPDTAREITVRADSGGTALNGYLISLVDDDDLTGDVAVATYDESDLKLELAVNEGVTTVATVVAAINGVSDFPFTAFGTGGTGTEVVTFDPPGADYSSSGGSDRGAASVLETVTGGGEEAGSSAATLLPLDADFGIRFTAKSGGPAGDGVTIRLLDDGSGGKLADGEDAAQVEYDDTDPENPFLNIYINNGFTTVSTVINGVNGADVPFAAELTGNGDGTDLLHIAPVTTVTNLPAKVSLSSPGENNDLQFTAANPGPDYNDVTVRFVDDGSITGNAAVTTYDADGKVLTVKINSGVTDANAVIDAVNAEGTFTAELDTSTETENDGTGLVQSHRTLTSGGGESSAARAVVRPVGDYNDILFQADSNGTGYNDVVIRFVDDGSIADGTATAVYNTDNKILTITIQNQFTSANAVIAAVNDASIPFTASNDGDSSGVGGIVSFEEAATGGGVSDTAEATVKPAGEDNDIFFQAESAGNEYKDVLIRFIDDGSITDGSATAAYDADSKTLTINIQNGATTATEVISAVNTGPNSGTIPFTATNADGSDGSGIIHTPSAITSGGSEPVAASLTVSLPGANNDFKITATEAGTDGNGVKVLLVHDDTITGNAEATYDDTDVLNQRLIIKVKNGTTTANDVITAVNDSGIPFTAEKAEGDGNGVISTATLLYTAADAGFIRLNAQGDTGDLAINAQIKSDSGSQELAAGGDVLFSGKAGALQSVGSIQVTAGGAVANTGSTAQETISTTSRADITLTTGAKSTSSTEDMVIDSLGKFTLAGSGLSIVNADLKIYAGDLLSIEGPVDPPDVVVLSSEDDVSITAPVVVLSLIDIAAGTDGSGSVTFTANLTGGRVNILAADSVNQQGDIAVTGEDTVAVQSISGSIIMNDGATSTSAAGPVSYVAGQDVAISVLASTSGAVGVAAGGTVLDSTSLENANISTGGVVTLTAVSGIGGVGVQDIDTNISILDASNTGDTGSIVIEETSIGGDIVVNRLTQTSSTGNGDIILSTLDGTITVADGKSGVSVSGSGSILLQAGDPILPVENDVVIEADISSQGGHISVIAADSVEQKADISTSGGSIDVLARAGSIGMGSLTVSSSSGGDIRYQANGNVTVSLLNAGAGNVSLISGTGSLLDNGDKDQEDVDKVDVAGAGLLIAANNGAGELGTGKGALETDVGMVSVLAGPGGISLLEADDVIVDTVSVSIDRLAFDGTSSAVDDTQSDLVTALGSGGSIVLRTVDGTITVNDGDSNTIGISADGAGNILLQAQDGDSPAESDIILNARVISGSGCISILAAGSIMQSANISTTTGTIDIKAAGGTLTMDPITAAGSTASGIRYWARDDMTIGFLNAGTGKVSLISDAGSLLDNGATNVGGQDDLDVQAGSLRLRAGAGVGALGVNKDALEISVDLISALAGSGGISLTGTGDIAVDAVEVKVWRVTVDGSTLPQPDIVDDSQSDLATGSGGSIVLVTTGALTLNDGDDDYNSVAADTTGNVRLEAGTGITINSAVKSGSGALTLLAQTGNILQASQGGLETSGASIDVQATAGPITMEDGATAVSSGIGDIRYQAMGDIKIGGLNAGSGNVSLISVAGSILDNGDTDLDIRAAGLRLQAAGSAGESGSGNGALEISVDTASALAGGGGISLRETDDIVVGSVAAGVWRVGVDGSISVNPDVVDQPQSDLISGANGSIVLSTIDGSITVTDGDVNAVGVSAAGLGNVLLQAGDDDDTPESDIVLNANVASQGGCVSILSANSISQAAVLSAGAGIDVEAQAGSITMTAGAATVSTDAGDVRYAAFCDVQVGTISGGAGNVSIIANTGSITDNGAINEDSGEDDIDVQAVGLRLQAATGIGEIEAGNGALETTVETVSALAGSGGINLTEVDSLTVGMVATAIKRVTADGTVPAEPDITDGPQSDLTAQSGSSVVLTVGGALTLSDGGDGDDIAVAADTTGNVLISAGGQIVVCSGVQSDTGHVVVMSGQDIIQKAGGAFLTSGAGTINVGAGGAISMEDGSLAEADGDGAVRYFAYGNLQAGGINAGSGTASLVSVTGSILDNASNFSVITAAGLRLEAAVGVGETSASGNGPLEIEVATVSAQAGQGGINLKEAGDVDISLVPAVLDETDPDIPADVLDALLDLAGLDSEAGASLYEPLSDLETTGPVEIMVDEKVVLQDGDNDGMAVQAGGSVLFAGSGNVVLEADVTTTGEGSGITVEDSVLILAGDHNLSTNNGNINLDEVQTETADSHVLTLTAGTGNITIDDNFGDALDAIRPAGLVVSSANDVIFTGSEATIDLDALAIISASGTVQFDGELNVYGPVDINTAALDLNASLNTHNNGAVTVTNSAVADLDAPITSEGPVIFDGSGSVALGGEGTITTMGASIQFIATVRLAENAVLTSNGGDIMLKDVCGLGPYDQTLTLRTETGSVIMSGDVGGQEPSVAGLDIQTASNAKFQGSVRISGTIQVTVSDDVEIYGPMQGRGGITIKAGQDGSGGVTVDTGGTLESTAPESDITVEAGNDSGDIYLAGDISAADVVRLMANSGALIQASGKVSGTSLDLDAAHGINGAGNAAFYTSASSIAADNTGAYDLNIINSKEVAGTVVTSLSTVGGDIAFTQSAGPLIINGLVTTGLEPDVDGGHVEIIATGGMTVNADISTLGGTGGKLTIKDGVSIQVQPIVGAGDIILIGDASDITLEITIDQEKADTIIIENDWNIEIKALVRTTSPSAHIILRADSDGDGRGGVRITAEALIQAMGSVEISGSDFIGTDLYDSVIVEPDGNNDQILAGGSISIVSREGLTNDSDIIISGRIHSTGGGDISVTAKGAIKLGSAMVTAGGSVEFHSPVVITDDSTITAGAVDFHANLDGPRGLVVDAEAGNVAFEDTVGIDTAPLGYLAIESTDVHFFNATAVAGDIDIKTNTLMLDAVMSTTMDGTVSIANTGQFTLSADAGINSAGAFVQQGGGSVSIAGDVTTSGGSIIFTDVVTLAGDVTVSTGAGTGNIVFKSAVDGAHMATLNAGAGDVLFESAVGGLTSLEGLQIAGDDITFESDVGVTDNLSLIAGGEINQTWGRVNADSLDAAADSGISLNTDVGSLKAIVMGTGDIYVEEADTITLVDVETTNGSITVTTGGTITAVDVVSMTDVDTNDILLAADGGDILVGFISAGALGDVTLTAAGGAIIDNLADESANLVAGGAVLKAAAGIGAAEDDLNVDVGTLNAANMETGDIFITEVADGADIEVTGLTQTAQVGGSAILIAENGTLTVSGAILLAGTGNVLLEARGDDSDVILNALVSSGTGSISVIAADSVYQNADINTAGTIDVQATNGAAIMADRALSTSGGNIRYFARTDVAVGGLNAGTGNMSISAADGSILDAGNWYTDIMASGLRVVAGTGVGELSNPLETAAGTVAAFAGSGGINLIDDDDVEIGTVGPVDVNRVMMDATSSVLTDEASNGYATTDGGSIAQASVMGTLTVSEPVSASGNGNVTLQANFGDILPGADVTSDTGVVAILPEASAMFTWSVMNEATMYYATLDRNGVAFDSAWVVGKTEWSTGYALPSGNYEFKVQAWTADGFGPTSEPLTFAIGERAETLMPLGSFATGKDMTFRWVYVEGATWYHVMVKKDGEAYTSKWIEGATEWSPDYVLPSGNYEWTVQPWSPQGYGLISKRALFSVGGMESAAPSVTGPTGTLPDGESVNFQWTGVSGATWYHLNVRKDAELYISEWVEGATEWTPGYVLPSGNYEWTVEPWSAEGYGTPSDPAEFVIEAGSSSQQVPSTVEEMLAKFRFILSEPVNDDIVSAGDMDVNREPDTGRVAFNIYPDNCGFRDLSVVE